MYICLWNAHKVHKHIGIRKHSKLVQVRNFLFTFLSLKVFRHEERERETQFLSMLIFSSDPHHVRHPPQTTGLASASSESGLASSRLESQLSDSTNKRASRRPELVSPRRASKSSFLFGVQISTNCFFSNPPNPQRFRA